MADPGFLQRAAEVLPQPTMAGGASAYFSPPAQELDPALFDGDLLKGSVRTLLFEYFANWLSSQGYQWSAYWFHLWLAGSGITYQWAADRGNGDLDVMISLDITPFIRANPQFAGWGEDGLAALFNENMKATLWPKTAATPIGGKVFEVTYYWNPGTGKDIRNIHPYAAYDLVHDRWDVRPPQLPEDPSALYPDSWFRASKNDADTATRIVQEYRLTVRYLSTAIHGTPGWHNAVTRLGLLTSQARALFDDIHLGRHAAFTDQGAGYGDYANFRWQRSKQLGVVEALRAIAEVGEEAQRMEETERYGAPIDPATVAARRAALWRSQR